MFALLSEKKIRFSDGELQEFIIGGSLHFELENRLVFSCNLITFGDRASGIGHRASGIGHRASGIGQTNISQKL
ncbi:MAG: hypothetical protein AAFP70_10785, partial [Calditrichota bacterium]